jgi:hypothetical protein
MATVYHRLVSLEEAVRRIENALGGIAPREVVEMDVADALGYVAAEDVYVKNLVPTVRQVLGGWICSHRIRHVLSDLVLFTTGRQASDMIFKAARVGIPITVSLRGPLTQGYTQPSKQGLPW